jgi:hypothetical protein
VHVSVEQRVPLDSDDRLQLADPWERHAREIDPGGVAACVVLGQSGEQGRDRVW